MQPDLYKESFWGQPTSTMDWCEANYEYSFYIAEFWNTLSNLFIMLFGLLGLLLATKQNNNYFKIREFYTKTYEYSWKLKRMTSYYNHIMNYFYFMFNKYQNFFSILGNILKDFCGVIWDFYLQELVHLPFTVLFLGKASCQMSYL
ncbi:hypothetical protein PPERSA_08065 [Pseudocohnilembus persalinus]|uniref:Uncharacterized protein n=1 Tax=Pseudocohnilembus persalinus TaxID=266149 RepID=A0A0V0R2M2_PSEPJ|nr:hypothetical protein PPERSA_08065 [Pseudocohnilembus persalinus]|eukprot:KRX08754.1 hypothetical protein PPERSA_08065 [Pseudocohnilembus persalinus]